MNADGTDNTPLTDDSVFVWPYPVAWSPDGTKIVFSGTLTGQSQTSNEDIYLMNADGSGRTRLTNDSGQDGGPSWSPDGTKIAFSSSRDGDVEIYVMNADGTGLTRLTNSDGPDSSPSWSP